MNSALCEIRTTLLHLCEIRTTPSPCANFWAFSSLPFPIPSLWASFLCSLMAKTRGGSTSTPQSSHRAAPVWAPLDAPPYLPDSAPQSRYYTRRATATPVAPTQIPARSPPIKKAKTSEPGEFSRAARDSQSQPPPTRLPILASSPIEGNSDCRARAFHDEAYFDHYVLRQ